MEMTIMDQKKEFILNWKSNQTSFSQLCRDFQISRMSGYKYLNRYMEEGMEGLEERSRAPHNIPHKTPQPIENRIIELRKKHPRWGAKKLRQLLINEEIYLTIPATSTIGAILKRNGLIPERKKRKHVTPRKPIFDPGEPNEIWSADFKGHFKLGDKSTCYPLTICDSYSRYILAIKGLKTTRLEDVQPIFKAVFEEHGLPLQLHTDNGSPFASIHALGRLTKLSVWFMELGIQPVFSDPGKPQQNGRHERMHRELKADACRKPRETLKGQQKSFANFVKIYNEERPHEALDMRAPHVVHERSKRPFPKKIIDWEYPAGWKVRYICVNGIIRIGKADKIFVSSTLQGKTVGLEPLGNEIYRLYFREFLLGYLDYNERKVYDILEYMYFPSL
jgi:transposase InsO family protein